MMTTPEALAAFTQEPLFAATNTFLKHLGVKCSTQTEEPIPFLDYYEEAAKLVGADVPKPLRKIFSRVEKTYFVGTVDADTLVGRNESVDFRTIAGKPKYEGMFVFAVQMKDGEPLSRTEASHIVRGVNRLVKQNPATVIIVERGTVRQDLQDSQDSKDNPVKKTMLSIATCERTDYKQTWRPGERLGRVSILRGIDCVNPHRGHIDILKSMDVKKAKNFDALYAQWKEVFSTSLLTKQFYREIQNWYFWALKKEQHVAFPNALDDDSDDEKYNAENIIRLITRLIFTWFMKEKGLVNPDLFSPKFLKKVLKHFNPDGSAFSRQDSQDFKDNPVYHVNPVLTQDRSCTYYRAILQNLFFATFNQEVGLRDFVDSQVRDAKRYNIKNYYRNEKLFTETDRAKIIDYFSGSPFVNGGLFECLDNVEQNGRVYSWDGFSNSVRSKDGSLKSALIPDYLFFGGETTADLSEFFARNKAAKNVKVRGIINILNDYVFTIEENTPLDENVALDPELLGKVFENLLGCYNPETQQMARNATGSFYTPRKIVNYMVKVTLKSYLKRACPKVVPAEIDALVDGVVELAEMPSVKGNAKDILTALFRAKILDPACGSGAFPMGIMSTMVEILRTVDPDNRHWCKIVLKESLDETESIADVGDEQERAELRTQIECDFKERMDHPDYARKLYIIEHCIFGSDIQPIAVQISRLRFFITLLCEQTKNDDPTKNYGITPLPNLESNFVAANSLLSIDLKDMRELLGQKKIVSLVKQLRGVRHQLFLPKTSDRKKRLQRKDEELRTAIATAAAGLYDENVVEKSKILESELRRCDQSLEKLTEDDFKDVLRQIEDVNLFGEKSVSIKKVAGKGKELKKRRDMIAAEIASLKNASRKERLLSDLKRLVAWNPFAFNVAETFLDSEWMFGVKSGFDIVIGNPPYISAPMQNAVPELRIQRDVLIKSERYKSLCSKWDLYIPFIEYGMQQCRSNGLCAMIVPFPLTNQVYGKVLRKMMVEEYRLIELADLNGTKVFDNVTVSNCIPFVQAAQPTGKTWISKIDVDFSIHRVFEQTSADLVQDEEHYVWNTTQEKRITDRHSGMHVLGDFCYVSYGLRPNSDEKIAKGEFKKEDLISEIVDGMPRRAYIEAKDIAKYSIFRVRYLEYGTERSPAKLTRPTFTELYEYPKLMFNVLGDLTGTIDDHRLVHNHSLIACVAWNNLNGVENKSIFSSIKKFSTMSRVEMEKLSTTVDLRYLLGVMNSKYVTLLLRNLRGGDYHIYPEHVRNIPIPTASTEDQQKIIALVDEILAAKKSNPAADTSALEAEIDEKVFDLYNLTPEEREIVKGNGK